MPDVASLAGFEVLAVDDEPNILTALRRTLRASGCRLQTAPGGGEGLALLAQAPVDLIISDMRMPGMNGAEFLRRAREMVPGAVRILLTGYADIGSTIEAVNEGEIYRYVSKPWDDEALLRTLREGLERKQLERERDRLLATVTQQHEALQQHAALLEQRVAERTQALTLAHEHVRSDFLGTVRMLSHLLDQRGGPGRGCGRAAAALVRAVGPRLGLSEDAVQDTFHAALLEDLGRLGLPDTLMNTPLARLAGDDRRRMDRVPVLAAGHLVALPSLLGASRVLHALGERWDGQGGPDGLEGEAIPAGSRLLRMLSDHERLKAGCIESRCFSEVEARRWLQYGSAKRYDPRMVSGLLDWLATAQPGPPPSSRLTVPALRPGMVLAQDLTAGHVLLVPQGRALDESLIGALAQLERRQDIHLTLEIETHERA